MTPEIRAKVGELAREMHAAGFTPKVIADSLAGIARHFLILVHGDDYARYAAKLFAALDQSSDTLQ